MGTVVFVDCLAFGDDLIKDFIRIIKPVLHQNMLDPPPEYFQQARPAKFAIDCIGIALIVIAGIDEDSQPVLRIARAANAEITAKS